MEVCCGQAMWMHITTALTRSSIVWMFGNELIWPPLELCISEHQAATQASFSTCSSRWYTVFSMAEMNL